MALDDFFAVVRIISGMDTEVSVACAADEAGASGKATAKAAVSGVPDSMQKVSKPQFHDFFIM